MTFYQETTSTSDSYQILHEEEAGAFGHVSVCQDVATGAVVAVKYLKKVSITMLSGIDTLCLCADTCFVQPRRGCMTCKPSI